MPLSDLAPGWYPDYQAPGGGWKRFWTGSDWGEPQKDSTVTAGAVLAFTEQVKSGVRVEVLSVTTTNSLAGYRVVEHRGEVMGITVRSRNMFSDMGARLRSAVGGEVAGYTTMLTEARREALGRMRTEAVGLGANAVIGMRMTANQIAGDMTELVAYGSAVVVEPVELGTHGVPVAG